MESVCAVCSSEAPRRCSSCSSVSYCSVEHQKQHWKIHRKTCPVFKVVEDSKLGKGFVATRDLKEGTIILEEEPVVVVHSMGPNLACLSCGLTADRIQDLTDIRKCSHCEWPVCSTECERLPIHADNECRIFARKKFPYPNLLGPQCVDDLIMSIRVSLLKRNNPALYEQIMQLTSSTSLPSYKDVDSPIEVTLKMLFDGTEGVEIRSDETEKLQRIFILNLVLSRRQNTIKHCAINDTSTRKYSLKGFYLQSSRINHSCIPNCQWQIGSKPEYKIRIRTSTAVKKGDPLTFFYYLAAFEEATRRRQSYILKRGLFRCECARCKDPTELGTYMSARVCKKCRAKKTNPLGYLLPEDPLNLDADAIWKCNVCGRTKVAVRMLLEEQELEQSISNMETQFGSKPDDDRLIHFCKRVVTENSGINLHPNHWIIQKAMMVMCRCFLNYHFQSMSLEWNVYLVKCYKHLLAIHKLLNPGITLSRATLHEQLGTTLHLQCDMLYKQRKFDQIQIKCEESLVHFKEALKYMETEIPVTPDEDTAAKRIKKNILAMEMNVLKSSGLIM